MLPHLPKFRLLCGLLLCVTPAFAQAAPDASLAAALRNLGNRAGLVFAGEVIAVRPVGGVVEVEFRVDQTIKGSTSGSVVLREWAGLWAAGQRRYWVGEHAVMFLHEAGKSGLSSSVDGMEGVLPMLSATVDVQRLETRVVRASGAPMGAPTGPVALAAITLAVQGPPPAVPDPMPTNPPISAPVRRPSPPVFFPLMPANSAPALAPILVLSPDALDDFDLDDKPDAKKHKTSTSPEPLDAGR